MTSHIQTGAFDIGQRMQAMHNNHDIGAIVSFVGHVRGQCAEGEINELFLEHYPGMTEASLAQIEADALAKWPLLGVDIVHRYGALKPGDAIVFVAVASPHRQAAFDAANFIMDLLKTQVPFWKREKRNGQAHWVESRDSDLAAAQRWS
ncbi:MAG: molybdenum cofactor biosynthesis protein MoaE [Moraxellaceae bacterium]|nr:molybdenum cofactor biosynthesis protein MoaE [Moraxellaceae bacterium]MDZ4299124.1 molybdenum cofactor biosynthesis protein MoaE [Moraxellaceae bacterium]MDZ4386246.1 molybdenum cofactor biosynthesis protein MoaE [Moraxellaceae bacterium]